MTTTKRIPWRAALLVLFAYCALLAGCLSTSPFTSQNGSPGLDAGTDDAGSFSASGQVDAGSLAVDGAPPADGAPAQTYAITGTVTGLSNVANAGLILASALPGGTVDQVTVNQDGAFSFSQKLSTGAAYAVTVLTNPRTPPQACVVVGGTGVVGTADVTSIVVSCSSNAFIVGGAVNGLLGSGLALANGADVVNVSGNGTFAFAAPLAEGGAYAVSVKTQPTTPSQTCAVNAGSGTVKGANVTSVTVACTTNTFPIGGAVTGLAGAGLVLEDGAGEKVSLTASGAFAFKTPLASGSTYTVTVASQPTSPWQTCSPASFTGVVGNGPVDTLALTCTTNTYAIGGSVTGLAGSGLVVSLGSGNDVPVASAGAFVLPQPVASGATYTLAVTAQPSSPAQSCVVTSGGTGTVAGAAITSALITCTTSTFAVGGTIVGLKGSGLVLTDEGADSLTVAAGAAAFTFKTPVVSGAAFDVEIATQPTTPAQTCSVGGNKGTVVAGAITGVVVNCSTSSFTIGGTVSGLAGKGLTLAIAGQTLPVNANGTFAFPTPLASGTSYTVSVIAQPTSPTQACTVTSGATGVVGSAAVTSVQVSCATTPFAVGGNVTGLAGAGLVLEDNGGDALGVTANGAFTFATKVPSGTGYDVTVGTQPTSPWQTCAVTNAAGAVAGAAVTNVAVACTTNTYSLGGTVSGLAGSGLAISLNGGAAMTLTGSASWSFPTPLVSGASYAVTIATEPTNPTQTCAIANAAGKLAGAAVTNVAITCSTTPFSIGGKVTGLTGTGLTITDNGGDATTIPAGATTFTLPTKIASGSTFDVEVGAQPTSPWQSCTPSGNKGTVGAGNVTTVAINCAADTFTIGGSVTGLKGAGLTLAMGGQTLAVSAAGGFAFPSPVASGTSYAVTVAAQPSGPTQSCAMTSGASGVVGGTNVNSVVVTCATSTFTVSGTVSGLAGAGLQLTDGTDVIRVASSGAFTFPALPSGTAYDVAVAGSGLDQPTGPWQTCTPSNNTGTVTTGAVTGVAVACTTNTYGVAVSFATNYVNWYGSIADSTSGASAGLPSNAQSFVLETLASGQAYNLSLTQPQVETCTLSSSSGTVTNAAVAITVTCPLVYPIEIALTWDTSTGSSACDSIAFNDGYQAITVTSSTPSGVTLVFPDYRSVGAGYQVSFNATPAAQTNCTCNGYVNVGHYITGIPTMTSPSGIVAVTCSQQAIIQ